MSWNEVSTFVYSSLSAECYSCLKYAAIALEMNEDRVWPSSIISCENRCGSIPKWSRGGGWVKYWPSKKMGIYPDMGVNPRGYSNYIFSPTLDFSQKIHLFAPIHMKS